MPKDNWRLDAHFIINDDARTVAKLTLVDDADGNTDWAEVHRRGVLLAAAPLLAETLRDLLGGCQFPDTGGDRCGVCGSPVNSGHVEGFVCFAADELLEGLEGK